MRNIFWADPIVLSRRSFAAPRVDLNIIGAGRAEGFGVHMAASIAPQVKFSAILAQGRVAAVTIDNSIIFPAKTASYLCFDNSHSNSRDAVLRR